MVTDAATDNDNENAGCHSTTTRAKYRQQYFAVIICRVRVADEAKKGRLRRRSGDGTDLGTSLYSYPAGTHPSTLAQYKVLLRCVGL